MLTAIACAQAPSAKEVESAYPDAHALYLDVHQNPELSAHETQTAAKLASRMRTDSLKSIWLTKRAFVHTYVLTLRAIFLYL